MSDKPWIDAYEPRTWTVLELPADDARPKMESIDKTYTVCGAESSVAANAYDFFRRRGGTYPKFFFYDFEQMSADHEPHGAGYTGLLTEPWLEFPAGTLVMITYEGIDREKPVLTVFIELAAA